MTIGLGTYAFFWQWHQTAETPLSLTGMVDRTADLGVGVFQVCDYPLFECGRRTFGATSSWPTASTPRWSEA